MKIIDVLTSRLLL